MNTAAQESHADQSKGKPKRVQLKHVQLDHNFFEKPKIVALGYTFPTFGQVLLIATLCDMSKATDGEIDVDCVRARAQMMGVNKAKADEFIAYCIERNIFHQGSKSYLIANRRVQEDQERMAIKQDKWRSEKRQQREPFQTNDGQTPDMCRTGRGPVKNEDLNTEDLKIEDLKRGVQGGGAPLTPKPPDPIEAVIAQLPLEKLGLNAPRCRASLRQWALNITTKHRKSFDVIGAEALVARYINRPKEFCEDLLYSVENGYRTVIQKPIRREPIAAPEEIKRRTVTAAESAVLKRLGVRV